MASPTVAGRAESATTTASGVISVTLPGSIAAGDLLLALIAIADALTVLAASGWTKISPPTSESAFLSCWYRQADGGEGGSAGFSLLSGTTKSAHLSYRITGHANPGTQAPEIADVATGTSTGPNPPQITPTGGTKDYLFLTPFRQAGEEADDDTWTNSTAPPFGNLVQKTSGTGGSAASNTSIACSDAASTTDTINPGAYSVDQSLDWHAYTIAVHPAAPVVILPKPVVVNYAVPRSFNW